MKNSINSFVSGAGKKIFKAKEYITREDAAMAIVKVLGFDTDQALLDGVESEISIEDIIADYNLISPANMKFVEIAVINELIDFRMDANGTLYFDPKKTITRFDLADLLWNAKQKRDYMKELNEEQQQDENQNNSNNNSTENSNSEDGNDYQYNSSSGDTEYPWNRDILVPFVDDPELIGNWISVDFVPTIDSFVPGSPKMTNFFLTGLNILPKGATDKSWLKWTKGHILNIGGDRTSGNLVLKEIGGKKYLFLQWICGDQLIRGTEPSWYVMEQKQ
jgi:hypothetical protein